MDRKLDNILKFKIKNFRNKKFLKDEGKYLKDLKRGVDED